MAQPAGGGLILVGLGRILWRKQLEDVLFWAAKGATYGATNGRPFYYRRTRAQPMAQPIGGSFLLGGPTRNLWRNRQEAALFSAVDRATNGATKKEAALFSAAERAIHGAANGRPFLSRDPSGEEDG